MPRRPRQWRIIEKSSPNPRYASVEEALLDNVDLLAQLIRIGEAICTQQQQAITPDAPRGQMQGKRR